MLLRVVGDVRLGPGRCGWMPVGDDAVEARRGEARRPHRPETGTLRNAA
jgi:hypothetical protein